MPTPRVCPMKLRSPSSVNSLSTPVDGVAVIGALSPSRAGDFLSCPLLYRFRNVDKLPEPFSSGAARGTLLHKVLEHLFDLPTEERTLSCAAEILRPAWEQLCAEGAEYSDFESDSGFSDWWTSCERVLAKYFELENPQLLEPAEREFYIEALLESKLLLRGFIDRLDVSPQGLVRVVDYKTGRSPGPAYEAKALFQMKFYALLVWRTRAVIPAMLQLIYLGNGELLRYQPDLSDIEATERKVVAIWHAIRRAAESGDWRPSPSRLCDWCAHQSLCPAFGGQPPPLPLQTDVETSLTAEDLD
jgi:putative RecB family exonuclease